MTCEDDEMEETWRRQRGETLGRQESFLKCDLSSNLNDFFFKADYLNGWEKLGNWFQEDPQASAQKGSETELAWPV